MGDSFKPLSAHQPFKAVVDVRVIWVDDSLDLLDRWFRSLKTMECSIVVDNVIQPVKAALFLVTKAIVERATKNINDTRIFVHAAGKKVTDVVNSMANSVVGAFNLVLDCTVKFDMLNTDLDPIEHMSEFGKTRHKLVNIITLKRQSA